MFYIVMTMISNQQIIKELDVMNDIFSDRYVILHNNIKKEFFKLDILEYPTEITYEYYHVITNASFYYSLKKGN